MKTFETLVVTALLILLAVVAIKNASGVATLFNSGAEGFSKIFTSIGGAGGSNLPTLPSLNLPS